MAEEPDVGAFLDMLERMPAGAELSFRGWIHDPGLPAQTLVTRTIIAASTNIQAATAGMTRAELGIVVARSGRDLSALSAVPESGEVTFPPGVIFHVSPSFELSGFTARVYEELTVTEDGEAKGMGIDPDELFPRVASMIEAARAEALPVPVDYCSRFLAEFE